MVISNIKLRLAHKKYANSLRKKVFSEEGNGTKSVGIVLDENNAEVVKGLGKIQKELAIAEENFKMLLCRSKRPKEKDFSGAVFTPAGIAWRGTFSAPEVEDFVVREFDLLIVYTRQGNKAASVISEVSNARFKVGRKNNASSGLDLTIATDFEDVGLFTGELKKYLKILNKI